MQQKILADMQILIGSESNTKINDEPGSSCCSIASPTTLAQLSLKFGALFAPLHLALRQVLKEDGRSPQSRSCMWAYRSAQGREQPVALFEYQPGRGIDIPSLSSKVLPVR
jgi:hypothetical protein